VKFTRLLNKTGSTMLDSSGNKGKLRADRYIAFDFAAQAASSNRY
jgi:hypothetical protein